MKRLWLIRHAKSSWADADLDDFERPLNKRGRRDAPRMAERLASVREKLDLLLASPAERARRTAEVFAEALGRRTELRLDRALYLAAPDRMLAVLHEVDASVECVGLVGHNPGITELANRLADAGIENVPTCGVVRLALDVEAWPDVAAGCARLLDFDYPKRADRTTAT